MKDLTKEEAGKLICHKSMADTCGSIKVCRNVECIAWRKLFHNECPNCNKRLDRCSNEYGDHEFVTIYNMSLLRSFFSNKPRVVLREYRLCYYCKTEFDQYNHMETGYCKDLG